MTKSFGLSGRPDTLLALLFVSQHSDFGRRLTNVPTSFRLGLNVATRWAGRLVNLRWMDGGVWEVLRRTSDGWCYCQPREGDIAFTLAKLGTDGRVWFRDRDLKIFTREVETLL